MNKKNIKIGLLKLLGVCVCVVSMLSCEDLVEDPRAELTPENFFQTEDDLAAAVSACFFPFMGHSWQGFDVRGFSLEAGDDQYTSRQGSNKERVLEFDEFGVTSGNVDIANSWQMIYQSIAACNAVINNGAGIEMDEEKKQQYLGQAYFVRSLMYFYLVRWYGNIPLVLESIEGEGTDIIRTDKEIVYQQIIDDAKMAENKLPKSWVDGGRPTLGAAKTLLSSIYLVSAGWPMNKTENYLLAAQKAKEVIEMGVYDLFDSYEDIWLLENENKKEWIFAMQGSINGGTPSKFGQPFMPPEESGWVDYFSEPHFFHIFPEGERKEVTFHTVFTDNTGAKINWEDGLMKAPFIKKFRYGFEYIPGENPPYDTDVNLPVYRYAEVLLIYAEAINKANGTPDQLAYECLNNVRRRAHGQNLEGYSDLHGLSSDDFDKAVLEERSWELAFEAKRWSDIVRREMVEEANAHNTDRLRNPITKERYIFPIPQREIDINPNLTQTPGY